MTAVVYMLFFAKPHVSINKKILYLVNLTVYQRHDFFPSEKESLNSQFLGQ